MMNEKKLTSLPKFVVLMLYASARKRYEMIQQANAATPILESIEDCEIYINETDVLMPLLEEQSETYHGDIDMAQMFLFDCLVGKNGCDTAEKFWETCFNEDGTLKLVQFT